MNRPIPGALPRGGIVADHDLRNAAHATVQLAYRGAGVMPPVGCQYIEIECEVYRDPGSGLLMVHSVCPRCRHVIKIDGANKSVEYDEERGLFVEAFTCPWELTHEAVSVAGSRKEFGIGLCKLRLEYAGREARDA